MPRRIKAEPRDCFKTFRFTEAEVTQLQARADHAGRTLSDFVRWVLFHNVPPATSKPAEGGAEIARATDHATRAVAEQMRKVGVNLNQIARRMNEQRIPPPRDLIGILADIRTYVRKAQEQ